MIVKTDYYDPYEEIFSKSQNYSSVKTHLYTTAKTNKVEKVRISPITL